MEIISFLKILLVEDSPADSRLLWEMLRDSAIKGRFALDPAVTLKEAISHLSSRKFDLVLLDLMLPDSAGLDTFRAVHKACPDVPVVLLTGLSDENLAARARKEVRSLIETVARTSNTSVLIMGETGTGKELVANSIHYLSSRRDGPFIKLNCSAIPDTLMEAEMFGYEKGAFTDAKQSKKGLFA